MTYTEVEDIVKEVHQGKGFDKMRHTGVKPGTSNRKEKIRAGY